MRQGKELAKSVYLGGAVTSVACEVLLSHTMFVSCFADDLKQRERDGLSACLRGLILVGQVDLHLDEMFRLS